MPLIKAEIIDNKKLTEDVFELSLLSEAFSSFDAGQFITVRIDDSVPPCFRAYSCASCLQGSGEFTLCIRKVEGGRGSSWLSSLKKGDFIHFIGPNGKFIFNSSSEKNILFLGVGVGFAPLKAILEDQLLNKKNHSQKMTLLFGVRSEKNIFYENFLTDLSEKCLNFDFKIALSRPKNPDSLPNCAEVGRVTDLLRNMDFDSDKTDVYICGMKEMVDDVNSILEQKGVPKESIYFEKYN